MKSINPNDIMTLDLESISYVTLKDGNMILVDDTIPQKTNKDKKNIPGSSTSGQNDIKGSPKEIIFEITSPLTLSFEGKIDTNKYKSNFKICSKITKNTSFTFDGIKTNQNNNNNFNNIEKNSKNDDKENKNNLNSYKAKNDRLKNNKITTNNNNNESSYSIQPSLKESETKQIKNIQNNNNNNNINNNINNNENDINFSKIEKEEYNQSNINTNLSIPMNFSNNNEDLTNSNNNQIKRKRTRGFGKGKRSRNSINAVCSLNIKAEEKYQINLINQFNSIVDKLNQEREKNPQYEKLENRKNNKTLRYYEIYKNKNNMKTITPSFLIDINNENLNEHNKRNTIYYNGLESRNNSLKNKIFYERINKPSSKISSNKIRNLRNKINRFSSGLVLPSNKMMYM